MNDAQIDRLVRQLEGLTSAVKHQTEEMRALTSRVDGQADHIALMQGNFDDIRLTMLRIEKKFDDAAYLREGRDDEPTGRHSVPRDHRPSDPG